MATAILMPKLGLTMTEGTIEEWNRKSVSILVTVNLVGDMLSFDEITKSNVPVDTSNKGIKILGIISEGVHSSDKAADTGTEDHVYGNPHRLEMADSADMSRTFCSSTAKDKGYGRTMLPDRIHSCINSLYRILIGRV